MDNSDSTIGIEGEKDGSFYGQKDRYEYKSILKAINIHTKVLLLYKDMK